MRSPLFPLLVSFQGSSQTHPFQEVFSDHPSQHDGHMPQRKQPWVLGLAQAHAHCKTRHHPPLSLSLYLSGPQQARLQGEVRPDCLMIPALTGYVQQLVPSLARSA